MPPRIQRRPYGRRRRRSWPARIAGWIVKSVFLFVLVSILWVLLYRFVAPPITFTMVGNMLGGRSVSREWMSLDEMDRDMVRAAIAAEDSKFCSHWGFDQDAIAEAMRRNARGGGVIRGGSTISQQTAKNAFLWQGGGYFRKGLEAWFTLLIENIWGKRRIMEVYLNATVLPSGEIAGDSSIPTNSVSRCSCTLRADVSAGDIQSNQPAKAAEASATLPSSQARPPRGEAAAATPTPA